MREWIPKNWRAYVIWAALVGAISIAAAFGLWPGGAPLPPLPEPEFLGTPPNGWVPDPQAVKELQATLEFKVFADTPAGQSDDPLPNDVFLWNSYEKLFGKPPPSKNQSSIGSCVSFGTNNAVARTLATQIVLAKGGADEFQDFSEEVTYGGSRVQVGGGKLGNSDGSVGAWAAQFVQKWGIVARQKYPSADLTTYSVQTCRTFGSKGVPADLQTVAKEHPIKDITLVKTWADAKRSLASGYGIAICSGVGFDGNRDANGVKAPRGSWGHCMCLDGYHVEGGKEYGHIENSWGPRPGEGPVGWGSPPDSGFWADSATVGKMLAAGDSWAFSAVRGWPTREINWFALAHPMPRLRGIDLPKFASAKEINHAMPF